VFGWLSRERVGEMCKTRLCGVLLAALFVLSGVMATTASAEEEALLAEWLDNGVAIAGALELLGTGEFIFGEEKGTLIRCSYDQVIVFNTDGKAEVTKILNLSGAGVTEAAPLLCSTLDLCESSETDIEAFPQKLPWKSLAFLMTGGSYLYLMEGEAWEIRCLVLGLKLTNECTFPNSTYELLNVSAGVEVMGLGTPLGNCARGGSGVGEMEMIPQDYMEVPGGTWAVSSE
jgi:hypothetical protein